MTSSGDSGGSEGGGGGEGPLILTALLPPDLQARMDALRRAHFPPERNHLRAHVTLFHALPPSCEAELRQVLARIVGEHPPPPGRVEGVMSLGTGTAVRLASPPLLSIRDELAERFHTLLSPQDRHTPRLHVTVQNKVAPKVAKALQLQLAAVLQPSAFRFTGLALDAYCGGPWRSLKSWSFRG